MRNAALARWRRAAAAAVAGALLLASLGSSPVATDDPWYTVYAQALEAMDGKEWTKAEALLKAAMKKGPKPGRKVKTYGVNFITYIPHYQLGSVYVEQGRYIDAMVAFSRLDETGLVSAGDPEYQDFTRLRDLARKAMDPRSARGGAVESSASQGLVTFARSMLEEGKLDEARRAIKMALEQDPENKSARDLAEAIARKEAEARAAEQEREKRAERRREALGHAQAAMAAGRFDEARRLASQAADAGASEAEVGDFRRRIASAEATQRAREAMARKDWAHAETILQDAVRAVPDDASLRTLLQEVKRALDARPTPSERDALLAYYSGDYERAAALLESIRRTGQPSARALLHLACSHASLALLQPGDRQPGLQAARRAFKEALRADAAVASKAPWISPAVLEALRP